MLVVPEWAQTARGAVRRWTGAGQVVRRAVRWLVPRARAGAHRGPPARAARIRTCPCSRRPQGRATARPQTGERRRNEPTEEESLTADRERGTPAERGAEGAVVDPLSLAWWAPPLLGPPDPMGTTEVMEPARGGASAGVWHLDPRRRRRVRRQVLALLCGLGERPGDVAESLRRAGARADLRDHGRPPVVRFLVAVVGADPLVGGVTVADGIVTVTLRVRWRATVRVPLPPPVATFAAAFEQGLYPALTQLTEPGP